MPTDQPHLTQIYKPSHDENARHAFVGALKGYVNGPLEAKLAEQYDHELKPEFAERHGHEPQDRLEGTAAFRDSHLYQLWGSSVITSQNLMWETVGTTCHRLQPDFEARRAELAAREPLGKLELAGRLRTPRPYSTRGNSPSAWRLFRPGRAIQISPEACIISAPSSCIATPRGFP